ncbi:MAG: SH3 domain-containing protein, partial [Prevotellaceae bacterium]|nr:SH3 domain-containing protein [Prevotellaceae bacterium]
MRIHYSFFLPIVCLVAACTPAATIDRERLPEQVVAAIDEVRTQYTPDQRVALLDTRGTALTTGRKNHIVLRGVTTSTEAKVSLSENLAKAGYTVTDSLRVLPDARSLNDKVYGIVNLSVINIRSAADYSSEMVTQALLGMPVRLLQRDGWLRLQTPDNYIGWTHSTSVTPMTKAEYDAWNRSEKLVVTAHYGFAYAAPTLASQTVGDVVAGNRFRLLGVSGYFYHVAYPDGKRAYIPHTLAIPEHEWRTSLKQDATSIIATAHTLMGIPF